MKQKVGIGRRDAIKLSSILTLGCLVGNPFGHGQTPHMLPIEGSQGKKLRLGIVGFGIRGEQLMRAAGFPTVQWKNDNQGEKAYQDFLNQEHLNIIFAGICDLYDARAESALLATGGTAKRYKNYKEMMASKDIDAVMIATPDHMHAPMVIEAARQGKHVYVEKCFTHNVEESYEVYQAVKVSGITFQLGHQLRQKDTYQKAKDILYLDILGKVTLIQSSTNRNSPNGAWVYDMPENANENNIDWHQFDKVNPFDLDRFFRWRKYWDYGTGLAGDLLTHEFDSLNAIVDMGIPYSAMASGGIYYYKDGREVPDVFQVTYEYPKQGLTYLYSATLANDIHRPTLIMGNDATMQLGNTFEIFPSPNSKKYASKIANGIMKPEVPFFEYPSTGEELNSVDAISGATTEYFSRKGMMSTIKNGKTLSPTHLHILEWLLCIRNGWVTSCNIEAAFQEAITVHMATLSYKKGKKVIWDESERKVIV